MSNRWETKFAEAEERKAAFEALPPEAHAMLKNLRARWLSNPRLQSQYECVRDECLKAWGAAQ